ncbi:cardiac-enriched FHL2-interacting protein [Myripristis murdjan]|uniref:cardiac-enriched FHL2-interacting protein n=1 Tax=Myripristis murdjan TaxID=586833 RepID=UPI0011762F7C|nr:cardiac-enriched FHL2-interacting protein-like [Myripristis murdjan]
MDSWTLQGDSYSFLRSAPRTFSLRHRDGTPNHVEIFDITSIPNHRSAISETTCLCDIFGDDCESPSLSSSPASTSVVPSQREVNGRAAASPLVDDLNDSSGSYHTAQGSSEGEEVFEDSAERLHSPTLLAENSERRQSEDKGLSSGNPGICTDIERKLEPNSKSPVPQIKIRRRVSVPDIFSRASTPDIENSSCSPELRSYSPAGRDNTAVPENQDSGLSREPSSTASTPAPRYTPPSPLISLATTPELRENSVSPEVRCEPPSPGLLSTSSPLDTWSRTPSPAPSPKIAHISPPSETSPQTSSPVVGYNLAPSPEASSSYSPVKHRHTTPSPEIRIIASSPEVWRKEQSSEVELRSNSLDPHIDSTFSDPRSLTSSPHITGISYSVVQPEDRDTSSLPGLSRLSTPESGRTHLSPEPRSPTPSRDSTRSSITESTGTKHLHLSQSITLPHLSQGIKQFHLTAIKLPHLNTEILHLLPYHLNLGVTSIHQLPFPLRLILNILNPLLLSEKHLRRQPPPKVARKPRVRIVEDMAHHGNRRRTPSPPLTRFTPVHIIAPEKPYRSWQNRSCSPPQVGASSLPGNLKKAVTDRESPNAAPTDNNKQAYWVRQERELERERQMQLEEERERQRERDRQRQRDREREMKRERKREEQVPEKGEGWQGDASYRGEQVELSFNARNRKGPASRSTAPTSRGTHQGMPIARSYPESLLSTRQLQQQQSLIRVQNSQQDTRVGGPTKWLQPAGPPNKNTAPGRVATNRPRQSSSSSMGSELDEADNEVKWFTDLAFRSLSSPEVDYLDMYNSSHCSSTNISQPSTQESPAGASAAWLAYADFKGSAPKLDNEDSSFQQPPTYISDGLDPSKRYEMGSFECVDVAVEREDSRRGRRGVPKRQIQLKRKNTAEIKQDEGSEDSCPGVPVMMGSPSLQRHSRETLVRQHSTPAAVHESYHPELSPDLDEKNERKSKLQKSVSLDETCTKTKMATCLIKSVLSKKMQSVDKQTEEHAREGASSPSKDKSLPIEIENVEAPCKEFPKLDTHNLSSSLHSDHSLSSEDLAMRREPSTKGEVRLQKNFGVKSNNRPSSNSSNTSFNLPQSDSEGIDSPCRNTVSSRSEMRSELTVPFDSKQSTTEKIILKTGGKQGDDSKRWEENEAGDSAHATAGNTGAHFATEASSTQVRMTNRDGECEVLGTEDDKQLQQGDNKSTYMSKTPEITLKASPAMKRKKKTSLSVSLAPEVENKPEPQHEAPSPEMCFRQTEESAEARVDRKTEEEQDNENNKSKAPIHKVRDVRRLVKNTYNLSFKATSVAKPSDENEGRTENSQEDRREEIKEERKVDIRPMQIECKAVCWKEDKNKMTPSKTDSEKPGDKHPVSPHLTIETCSEPETSSSSNTQSYTARDTAKAQQNQPDPQKEAETHLTETETHKMPDSEDKPVVVRRDRKPPMLGSLPKLPSKEREVSTAVVVIREGSSKTKTSSSPAHEEIPTSLQAPSTSPSPGSSSGTIPGSSSHSVSMLLKEKGYQADIGAVVGEGQTATAGKGLPHKHVNRLEIPLQTAMPSDGAQTESRRERTFSSSSTKSDPTALSDNTETLIKTSEEEGVNNKTSIRDSAKQNSVSSLQNIQQQTTSQVKQGDFEAVKRQDPTFPPRSPAMRRFRPQPIEVKSLSKETQKQEMPTNNMPTNRPQTIEVKSIAKNSQKPVVPPKPSYKFKPADLVTTPNESQKSVETTSGVKPQGEERSQTIVVSSPTIYRKLSSESTATSNYTRKLAVSTVSSYKPPPSKTTATSISSLSNRSTAPSETEASHDRAPQQQTGASPQSSRHTQRPTTLATAPTLAKGPGLSSAPGPVPDLTAQQVPGPSSVIASQESQPAVMDTNNQPLYPRTTYPQDRAMLVTSNDTKQPATVSTTQAPGYTHTHHPYHRSLSNERSQRADDLRYYASDDPPSYDERESFSPLLLPDLTPRRPNRYQPTARPPPCSCTSGCPSHPGLTPPHHHHSPHNITPPGPSHSPGQAVPYPVAQPQLRPHQCRADPQPMSYQPSSPKSSLLSPGQPPAMYQPLHQPPACPPHPSLMQPCPSDRPLQPPQHIDPRRPPVHRSPQQQPPGVSGSPYNDPGHSHSPNLPSMDPQYLCGPQSLGPSYGSEYGADSSSLYSESSYGQTPRRVLMDPETGKYFYIEVPMQPLRKMLFDPETGQYVEVLIPQQAMSHSGLYPPSAAPYPSLHNPSMYASAPQYLPYAAPPPPPHPQGPPQPTRHPEASASAAMHQNGPGVGYGNPPGQGSKPEPQNHPPLDQSYLEGMYYVPTGMNASPNPTPPDCYHKHPPNLPSAGGKRS